MAAPLAAPASPIGSTSVRSRFTGMPRGRKRPAATATAYAHALAITRDSDLAHRLAITAMKKGGLARIMVIAHARHLALEALGARVPVDLNEPVADAARDLAWQLAGTRPGVERAIVDLELRYGLDPASYGRALGLSATDAADRANRISEVWAGALDPAFMASLGSAGCADLEAVLLDHGLPESTSYAGLPTAEVRFDVVHPTVEASHTTVTLAMLLDVAPAVRDHALQCDACANRLRSMTSVRTLVGTAPVDAVPDQVSAAAASARRRIGAPPPPSIAVRRFNAALWKRVGVIVVVVAAIGAVGYTAVDAVVSSDDQQDRVARLIEAPVPANP